MMDGVQGKGGEAALKIKLQGWPDADYRGEREGEGPGSAISPPPSHVAVEMGV